MANANGPKAFNGMRKWPIKSKKILRNPETKYMDVPN